MMFPGLSVGFQKFIQHDGSSWCPDVVVHGASMFRLTLSASDTHFDRFLAE